MGVGVFYEYLWACLYLHARIFVKLVDAQKFLLNYKSFHIKTDKLTTKLTRRANLSSNACHVIHAAMQLGVCIRV